MKHQVAAALAPLLGKVRTDARGVKKKGGKPYKENKPLTLDSLEHHANGGPAYGAYFIKPGESVCAASVLDLDSHKGETSLADMLVLAARLTAEGVSHGVRFHVWISSGGQGVHLWALWSSPQDARSVRHVMRQVIGACGFKDGANGVKASEIEIFPKQDRVGIDAWGNYAFLPGAFASVPVDDVTFEVLTKEDIVGYQWHDSRPVQAAPTEPERIANSNVDVDFTEVMDAVACIPNVGDGFEYDTWFRIIAGIHAADSGEDGREVAEAWSEQSDKHTRAWFEHTWANLKSDRDNGAGVGTLFHYARQHGWDRHGPAVAAALDAIDIEAALALIPAPPIYAMSSDPVFDIDKYGAALATLGNLKMALEHPGTAGGARLGYDTFKDELMVCQGAGQWRPINDVDLIRFRLMLESPGVGFKPIGRELMRDAVQEVADAHKFDSAMLWLSGLAWDGTNRVDTFLTRYFGADDTPYIRACSRYFWTALAGRVMVPGVQADITIILQGLQGGGKSTGLQLLVPSPEFFVEINLAAKDDDLARLLRAKLLVELGELKGLNSREIEHTKSFLTKRRESWVPKFQEFAKGYDRRCVFVGTTNADEFLEDQTGHRRFAPVKVGVVDRDAIAADVSLLWAEARDLFEIADVMWQECERLARFQHDEFVIDDPWAEAFGRWMDARDDKDAPFTAVEIIKGALLIGDSQLNQAIKKRAASILKRLGFKDGRGYLAGHRCRMWATEKYWDTQGLNFASAWVKTVQMGQ